jgi:phosphoglycolate phosphatase
MSAVFKLLVFDWDGTLMDSEARIVSCLQKAIGDLQAAPRERDELRNVIGLGLHEAIVTLYPEADRIFVRAFAKAYRTHFLTLEQNPNELFEGALEVLAELKLQGYLLAVATGKARAGLEGAFRSTRAHEFFHASRCADETSSKPHPLMLQEVVSELGVKATETLMIGDTVYDMQMSHNAGTHALAVSYGVHELTRLLAHDPLGHIDNIIELPDWLDAWRGKIPHIS